MNWQERAKELSCDHWDYHDVILPVFLSNSLKNSKIEMEKWGKWYREIFQHGYKHAIEDIQQGKITVFRGEE